MTIETLADFFMPEAQKHGEDLFNKDVISIASASDTQADAFVRASGSPRVSLKSDDIASSSFQADCTCSAAKKGRLCKHIWATLLKLKAIESDFLACKTLIEKATARPESEASLAAKVRQAEYKQKRKDENKARNKKFRQNKKTYPYDVEAALTYFSVNGFEFSEPLQVVDLDTARKSLSYVFHPDRGGTHTEILTLNENYDIITAYLSNC